MEHLRQPEQLGEPWENRQAAVRNLAAVSIYLTNITECYNAQAEYGQVDEEVKRRANEAGAQYNDAIRWLLSANEGIREAEHGGER